MTHFWGFMKAKTGFLHFGLYIVLCIRRNKIKSSDLLFLDESIFIFVLCQIVYPAEIKVGVSRLVLIPQMRIFWILLQPLKGWRGRKHVHQFS